MVEGTLGTPAGGSLRWRAARMVPAAAVARVVAGAAFAILALLVTPQLVAAAAPQVGYVDGSISGASDAPSGSKPESKLWFHDGSWWASMFDASSRTFRVYRLDQSTETWSNVGPTLDTRTSSRADVLADGDHVYVASHVNASDSNHNVLGQPSRLWRLSYNATTRSYSVDAGFPVQINNVSSETLVIDKDSTGTLWATWTQAKHVFVAHTTTDDATWSGPIQLTIAGTLNSDDIDSVIAFGGNKLGVLWSNQAAAKMYFSVHADGAADTAWSGPEVAASGSHEADDHINLKTDSAGRVYAAVKTSKTSSGDPLINLLVRSPGGSWSKYLFGTVADSGTRPIVVVDEPDATIRMFDTGPWPGKSSGQSGGTIYEKDSPLGSIAFAPGLGTPVIQDPTSADMNNVTSTKQNVDGATGLVLLATNDGTNRYWHADLEIAPPPPPPVADFSATPTSGNAPLGVQFSDLSTNSPTSWSWTFGDGGTSSAQNPSHTYVAPGSYTVTLVATNAGGSSAPATKTDYIVVGQAPAQLEFDPVADAQVSSSNVNGNYGGLATVKVRLGDGSTTNPNYYGFLKFDVAGLLGPASAVTLRLYVTDASRDTVSVRPTDSGWSESTITYATAPPVSAAPVGSASGPAAGGYVDIALDPTLVGGDGTVSVALTIDGTDSLIVASRESANPPILVVSQP